MAATETVELVLGQIQFAAILGWEAMESNREFRSWHNDRPWSRGDLDHSESARGHRGSGTKSDGDDHRASQRRPRSKPVKSAVRLLPEGWTVFVNSLRQVQYSHVKTGMICFQIPENPEVLNNLFFFKECLQPLTGLIASAKIVVNQSRANTIPHDTTIISTGRCT